MKREHRLEREQRLPFSRETVFAFFAEAQNLARITPRELGFVIVTPLPIDMREGTLIDYTIRLWGVPMKWRTRITEWVPPFRFVDEQIRGPYRQWIHTHTFEEDGDATIMRDEVRYVLPFSPLGDIALPLVRRQLRRIFDYREATVESIIAARGFHPASPSSLPSRTER